MSIQPYAMCPCNRAESGLEIAHLSHQPRPANGAKPSLCRRVNFQVCEFRMLEAVLQGASWVESGTAASDAPTPRNGILLPLTSGVGHPDPPKTPSRARALIGTYIFTQSKPQSRRQQSESSM
jgi:hypothetical protein